MSRYIFSKNNRWYISQIFNPSDSKLQEKAAYYTLTNDITGPYCINGTSDSASIVISYAAVPPSVGQLEAGVIDANGNFQPLAFNGTQASDSGSAIQGLQPKIFNTGHAEPVGEPAEGELEAGVINANGDFQPLSFNGTQASDSGSAIQGLEPAIFNTGHEEPAYVDSSTDSGMKFYKCASVQESPLNTWTGYKAVFNSTTGMWGYQSDSTSLTWTATKPVVNNVYSADMTVQVTLLSGNSNTN